MLDPELISHKLIGKTFISEIFYFDEIDSTNNFAKQNKLPCNSLIITNHQPGGRGRFGRKWESEKGKNLTFTIVKKIDLKSSEQINLIYSIANAVYETLNVYLKSENKRKYNLKIKWPNDILVTGKKIAGILIETKTGTGNFFIGVGINVNQRKFKGDLQTKASSLASVVKKQIDLNVLLINLLKRIEKGFNYLETRKFTKIYGLWKRKLNCIGKNITFIDPKGKKIEGVVNDILHDGQIIIEQNGKISGYYNGEIRLKT